jgi:hypothetical protein
MKTIIQKSLVKIAAWYFLVLKKIPELKFSIRNISIHLTSTTILWSGIVTICVIPLFIVLSLSLVIEG